MSIEQPGSRKRYRKLGLPHGMGEVWLEQSGPTVNYQHKHPNGGGTTHWNRCRMPECLGDAVINDEYCLNHVDAKTVDEYFHLLADTNQTVSFRGMEVNQVLFDQYRASSLVSEASLNAPLDLTGAVVSARIAFDGFNFPYYINFNGATFHQSLIFRNCTFKSSLSSSFAFFNGGAPSFVDVDIDGLVDFSYAHVERTSVGFTSARFGDRFSADGFEGTIFFRKCQFESEFQMASAATQSIQIEQCSFKGQLALSGTSCSSLILDQSDLSSTYFLGPIKADNITVRQTVFGCRINLDLEASSLDLSGSRFVEGGQLDVKCTNLDLTQLGAGRPIRISGSQAGTKPIVLSLRDADTGLMTFSNVDMSRCQLYGARDLRNVIIESNVTFLRNPGPFRTMRKCIADEYLLRIDWGHRSWRKKWEAIVDESGQDSHTFNHAPMEANAASQVSGVYRELRHSYEAKKDWLGASDFYYGEMEMRRLDSFSPILDRSIVYLYWLASGYGLRVWRALFSLLLTVAIGALFFFLGMDSPSQNSSIFYIFLISIRSVIPGLSARADLSYVGQLNEIALAIIGPVLLALTALAIRERTKR